ncbi:MAG TPA: MFS transporter, partial [Rhodospirillales bacterium]|nr:MFS transporter [Rhodospirillales bacterium]
MSGAALAAPVTAPERAQPMARAPVLVVYAAALLQGMTLVSFPAVSAVLKQALALSDADYGAIFLPQVALAIIGGIAAGALARRIGLKALLLAALAANGASQALLASAAFVPPAGGFTTLLAGTACLGFGFGLIGAPINAYPGLLFPKRAETAIVAAHTLIGLGLALGPLVAAPLVAAAMWFG